MDLRKSTDAVGGNNDFLGFFLPDFWFLVLTQKTVPAETLLISTTQYPRISAESASSAWSLRSIHLAKIQAGSIETETPQPRLDTTLSVL
jgi:hypothetical protein